MIFLSSFTTLSSRFVVIELSWPGATIVKSTLSSTAAIRVTTEDVNR
jgi:hypothetical protein